jgi:signal transduction histidine kinase
MAIIPLSLEVNARLEAENFFCFLSPQISFLVLLQQPEEKPGLINIWQSFSPLAIANFLNGLKQGITIEDHLPADVFAPPDLPPTADLNLVNQLVQSLAPLANAHTNSPQKMALTTDKAFLLKLIQQLATPLTNMKTALRLLESLQQKKEARQRYLDLIKQNCDQQNALVTGVQELLSIDPIAPAPQIVNGEDCIAGVVGIYQPIANEKGIELTYTIAAGCPAIATTVTDLRQILQRLLENSLKFTPRGGRVQVKAQGQSQGVEIIVSDTGCGVATAEIPHLFDFFFQGRQQISEELGAGLGLTIVQNLVQRWGGKITVQSRPGRGCSFHLLLPKAVDDSLGRRFVIPG